MTEIIKRLIEFEKLENGWDSYGSVAIARFSIIKAIHTIILSADLEFTVVPSPLGHVLLEYHKDGHDIEIEYENDGDTWLSYENTEAAIDHFEGRFK